MQRVTLFLHPSLKMYCWFCLQSRGRLAYISIPIADYGAVEKSIRFYEETFISPPWARKATSLAAAAAASAEEEVNRNSFPYGRHKQSGSHRDSFADSSPLSGLSNPGGASNSSSSSSNKKNNGFRLVDMERFVEELTTYVWMANGSRKKHTAVCLMHKVQRRAIPVGSNNSNSGSRNASNTAPTGASGPMATGGDSSNSASSTWNDLIESEGDEEDDDWFSSGAPGDTGAPSTNPAEARASKQHLQAQMSLLDRKLEANEAEDNKLFLGLSFAVNDLEQAISFLKKASEPVQQTASHAAKDAQVSASGAAGTVGAATAIAASRLEIQHVSGFPRFISFFDPGFVPLELSDGAMALASTNLTTIHTTGSQHHEEHVQRMGHLASYAQRQQEQLERINSMTTYAQKPRPPAAPNPGTNPRAPAVAAATATTGSSWSNYNPGGVGGGGGGGQHPRSNVSLSSYPSSSPLSHLSASASPAPSSMAGSSDEDDDEGTGRSKYQREQDQWTDEEQDGTARRTLTARHRRNLSGSTSGTLAGQHNRGESGSITGATAGHRRDNSGSTTGATAGHGRGDSGSAAGAAAGHARGDSGADAGARHRRAESNLDAAGATPSHRRNPSTGSRSRSRGASISDTLDESEAAMSPSSSGTTGIVTDAKAKKKRPQR
jgi:hypothetical protein